jgi:hypothetical protein
MNFPIIQKTTEELEKATRQPLESFEKDRKAIMLDPQKMFYRHSEKGIRKPTRITFEMLRRMSKSCSIARLAINTLKHELVKTKWSIVARDQKESPDDKRITEVEKFFNFPNPDDNFRTFLLKVVEDILSLDAGCIEMVKNGKGNLLEMYYVDGSTIKPAIDIHGIMSDPAYYQYMPLNNTETPDASFSKDELLYIMQNPQGDIKNYGYGLAPIEGVLMVATNILNADNYNGSFFDVGTLPPLLINLGKNMPRTEVENFRAYWKAEIEGKPWKTAFYGGAEAPEIMKLQDSSNRDMQFYEYQTWLAKLMCAAFEISPQDIGLTMEINKATAETQREISKAKGYRTLLEVLEETFTQGIIWKRFGYDDIMFKWQDVDSVDELKRAQVWAIESKTGARSVNEYRKEIGLDPIKGGVKPYILGGTPFEVDATPLEELSDAEIDAEQEATSPQDKQLVSQEESLKLNQKYNPPQAQEGQEKGKVFPPKKDEKEKPKPPFKKSEDLESVSVVDALMPFADAKLKQIAELLSIDLNKFSFDEFKAGMREEMEHEDVTGGDPLLTGKIVFAHLKEDGNYYSKLKEIMKAMTFARKWSEKELLKKKLLKSIVIDPRAEDYFQKSIPTAEAGFIQATTKNLKEIYDKIVEPQAKKIAAIQKGWVTINGNHILMGDEEVANKLTGKLLKVYKENTNAGEFEHTTDRFIGSKGEIITGERNDGEVKSMEHQDVLAAAGVDAENALDSGILRVAAYYGTSLGNEGKMLAIQSAAVPNESQIRTIETAYKGFGLDYELTFAGKGLNAPLVKGISLADASGFGFAVRQTFPQLGDGGNKGLNPADYINEKAIQKAEDDFGGEWDDEYIEEWDYAPKKEVSALQMLVVAAGLGLMAKLVADSTNQANKKNALKEAFLQNQTDIAEGDVFAERSAATSLGVAQTLRDEVRSYLQGARDSGASFDQMAKDLTELMGLQDEWRGKRIARTESVWATKETASAMADKIGVDEYTVLFGSNPCNECIELFGDGKGPFTADDIDVIPVHPNCECVPNLIIPDDWQIEDYL